MTEIAIEMRSAIIALAGDRSFIETRQRWLDRAAQAAGITSRSAKSLFYCEDREPRASTVEKVRRALEKRQQQQADAKAEERDIRERLAYLEQRMATIDESFYEHQAAGIRAATHPVGAQTHRSGGEGGALG